MGILDIAHANWWITHLCAAVASLRSRGAQWSRATVFYMVISLGFLVVAQPANPERGDIRLVILSDFNASYGSLSYPVVVGEVLAYTTLWQPDLFLSAGDVIAGQSRDLPTERFTEMWAAFDHHVATPLRQADIPYAVALGNHDGSSQQQGGSYIFAREREAARTYWQQDMYQHNLSYMSREDFPFHYSFVLEGLFIVVIDASSANLDDWQRDWLLSQLSSDAAQNAEMRVVVGHLPLIGIAEGRNRAGEVITAGGELIALLQEHEVQLYISGHHHAFFPGRVGQLYLLHTGGIPARRLLGMDAARSTVQLLDIWFSPLRWEVTAFDLEDWSVVKIDDLPTSIEGINGPVWRWDLP